MRPFKEFLILIGKQSLYFGEGRHKDTQNLQKGEVKGSEIELYIANLLRRIINLQAQNEILTREDISRLGKMLYNFLKEWNLDVAFRRFFREIAEIGSADPSTAPFGRIYLEFEEDAELLAILPWEYLSYGENEYFLGADKDFRFDLIRRYSFLQQKGIFSYSNKPVSGQKANVLLIVSEPRTKFLEFGGNQIIAFFQALHGEDRIGLEVISQPTFDGFPQQLESLRNKGFHPDIIHFAGLGEIHDDSGYVGFIDRGDEQKPDWITDRQFIDFLDPFLPGVKLVFLHACQGGVVGDYATQKGLGLQFLHSKVPSLVAMQAPVKPQVVFDFAQVFYASLLDGEDVARAVTAGRKKLCFELQERPQAPGGKKDEFRKRFNPYGEKSFGIPVIYITTEEPFPLIEAARQQQSADSGEPKVYYECQNKPNPRCIRIKLVEPDEQGCPVCGGPLVAITRQTEGGKAPKGALKGQSALQESTARAAAPEKNKGGNAFAPMRFEAATAEDLSKPATTQEETHVILFLGVNPKDTRRLRLDEEVSLIQKALDRSKYRDKFELKDLWAVNIPDLFDAIEKSSPEIIHFSGHGSETGNIYLEDKSGNGQEITPEALSDMLRLFKKTIRCVVLNACYSETLAGEILKQGIPVIGMRSAVPDQAGLVFSERFYNALGNKGSIDLDNLEYAFESARSAVKMEKPKAEDIPVFKKEP